MFELLRPFIISFVIGLLIGTERERSHPEGMQAIGIRTFTLFALLGTVTAFINSPWLTLSVSLFVFCAIIASYIRTTEQVNTPIDIGITTEISAAIVFCLGYIAMANELIAIALGVTVLAILFARKPLHHFARDKISRKELHATLIILFIALAVLSFLPNETIDPWQLVNPQRLGFIVLALASIQFGGYLAIRIAGKRLGMMLMGFCGGLVSSTAVFVTLPATYRNNPTMLLPVVAAAIFSVLGMLVEFLLVVGIAAPSLIDVIIWPVLSMMLVGSTVALFTVKANNNSHTFNELTNPLDLKSILRLALLIASMLALASIAKRYVGAEGLQIVAFITSLFEMHSMTLATATLFTAKTISLLETKHLLGIILIASFLSKLGILWSMSPNRFAVLTTFYLLMMISVGGVVFYWVV